MPRSVSVSGERVAILNGRTADRNRRGGQLTAGTTCARRRPVAANVEGPQPRDSFWVLRFLVVHDESHGSAHCGVTGRPGKEQWARGRESRDPENRSAKTNSTVLTTCKYERIRASMHVYRGKFFDSNRARSSRRVAWHRPSSRGRMEVAVRFDLHRRGRC